MRSFVILAWVIVPALMFAQQPSTDKRGKKEPESPPLGAQQQKQEAPLPAIDLPEFVITGSASINPPDAHKYGYDEQGLYVRHASENSAGTRERETVDLGERFKQSLLLPSKSLGGTLRASLGNFFTPELAASVGLTDPSYDLAASAYYRRTKGFTRFADASRGGIAVQGSHELITGSSVVQQARLFLSASYDLNSYKFYGSLRPMTQRSIARYDLRLRSSADLAEETSLRAGLEIQGISVKDSSTTTTENGFRVDAGGSVPLFNFPVDVYGKGLFSTVTTVGSRKLSLVTLGLGTPRLSWGEFSMRAGVEGHSLEGMNGQKGSYFFPYLFLDYRIAKQHGVFASFDPAPVFHTLEDHVGRNPYLSGSASIRHPIARVAVAAGFESDWNDWLRTRAWLEFKSFTDYPFFADSAGSGMWLLAYGGKTTFTSVHSDGVANISTNDYFAFQSTLRISKSSIAQHVPYIPEFEASASWTHRVGSEIEVSPRLGIVSSQFADFSGPFRIEGYIWTGVTVEYLGLGDLRFFLDVTNLVDQKYELWKGYRAEPFRIAAGLTYRW